MNSIKKIVCALDLTDFSPHVASYAAAMGRAYDAEVVVVHASHPLTQYSGFGIQPHALESFSKTVLAGARNNMEEAIAEHFTGVKAEPLIVVGKPEDVIIETARSHGADLIIMGTHGRKGPDRFMMGSVAQKVVRDSKMPVFTVPHDGAA